jgi:hypothetical protein
MWRTSAKSWIGLNNKDGISINQQDDYRWTVFTNRLIVATLMLLVAYTTWYLMRHSDFNGDDLSYLIIMKHSGFWSFILTVADVHYVPLHQFLTWLVYHIAPMDFAVPVAVLIIFHVGTLVYLTLSLREIGMRQAGGLLVCGYAASSLIIIGFVWWAHSEHRVPYVFLDVCAIYHYLAWIKNGRSKNLWISTLAFVAAFGFYEKAIFIPMHMLVIGYLCDELKFRKKLKQVAWPPVIFAFGSILFVIAYLYFFPQKEHTPIPLAIRVDAEFVKVLLSGATGLAIVSVHDVPINGLSIRLFLVLAIFLTMFAWSFIRGNASYQILLAMLLVLFVDFLPIAISARIEQFGLNLPRAYRFYYEELHLIVFFVGLWFARIANPSLSGQRKKILWITGFLLMAAYAGINAVGVRQSRMKPMSYLWTMNESHMYLRHLRHGLAGINEASPIFENDQLPRYMTGLLPILDTKRVLPLFVPDVRSDDTTLPRFKVEEDGHIVCLP